MSKLVKTLAAAAIAAPLVLGGAAMAADADIQLTDDQQFAVTLVKDFNTCAKTGYEDPAFVAAVDAVNEYGTKANELIANDPELSAKVNEAQAVQFEIMFAGSQEQAEAAAAKLEALVNEVNAAIEANLGPAPEAPADPAIACEATATQTVTDAGTTFDAVNASLSSIEAEHGRDAVIQMITPAP